MAKAFLLSEQLIKLILAAAGIFIIVFVVYRVLTPPSNNLDETAEAYFKQLEKAIETADSVGSSEIKLWNPDSSKNFYLVYFGEKLSAEDNQKVFLLSKAPSNTICICYVESEESNKGICSYCKDLGNKAFFEKIQGEDRPWVFKTNKGKIKIIKNKEKKAYIFKQ